MLDVDHEIIAANPVGARLKKAREAKDMSLDEIASRTRVPIRHLQHIENGEWDALPAPTYTVGFARSYANAVGLNGTEVANELREQLGAAARPTMPAYYQPADPARVPPRSLALIAGVLALVLVIGFVLWRSASLDAPELDETQIAGVETALPPEQTAAPAVAATAAGQPLGGPSVAPGTAGPVTLTATEDVWLRVYEAGGGAALFQNTLKAGERYQVPSNAVAPQIRTGRPTALQITVGTTVIPPLGSPEQTISDVSLAPADLLARAGVQPAPAPGAAAPAAPPPAGP
jgi:cytoskeleton protein RodZ